MNIFLLIIMTIISPILNNSSSKNGPVRLGKVEKTSFEKTCERVVPYVLLFALLIFGILLLVVLVKYGHSLTGTESNIYYYHLK